jgi:CRISPR/Cas system CSM-associated protein Csm3 (group 7 of RAMP superfamily)
MAHIELDLGLRPLSAWHVGTGYGLAGVLDARTVRTGEGTLYIPGSTVKGRVRYHFRRAMDPLGIAGCEPAQPCRDPHALCPLCSVFGSIRRSGALFFSDLRLVEDQEDLARLDGGRYRSLFEHDTRTNVMISRLRGVAFEQRLFTTEVGTPELYLVGDIRGRLNPCGRVLTVNAQTVPKDVAVLVAAIRMVTHLGGRKSRGLGRCRFEIRNLEVDDSPVAVRALLEALLQEGDE